MIERGFFRKENESRRATVTLVTAPGSKHPESGCGIARILMVESTAPTKFPAKLAESPSAPDKN